MDRDWASLPQDLINLISKKLCDISDYIRFRTVCKMWLSASPLSGPPPQLPWLLDKKDWRASDLRFYSLSSGDVRTINSPQSAGRWVDGPSHHYLLTYLPGSSDYRLLNPLTCKEISLPGLDLKRPRPILIGPDPIQSDNYVVALNGNSVYPTVGSLAVFQFDNMNWVTMVGLSGRGCYCDGKYVSITGLTDNVHVFDFSFHGQNLEYEMERIDQMRGFQYLIVSSGEILRVCYDDDKRLPLNECKFKIHKLNFGIKPNWVRITSIGDQMLFLDKSNGFSVSSNNFGGFRGNCIYFLKERENKDSIWCNYSLCRYDIESERAEELPCPFVRGGTWFVPSLFPLVY